MPDAFVPPPTPSTVKFLLVIFAVQAILLYAVYRTNPDRAAVFAVATNLLALALALTRPGAALAAAVVPAYWVIFQGFRVPLEFVLHAWGEAGTIPVQMTWSGQNFDVVAGLLALVLGFAWLKRPGARWLGITAHVIGLALLANVGRIAVTSLPTSFQAFEGAPLLLPFHAPYIWILPFAVAAALFTHVVGLRAIFRRPTPPAPAPTG